MINEPLNSPSKVGLSSSIIFNAEPDLVGIYLLYAVVLLKEYFSPISYIPADPADADTISIEPV